MIHDLFDQVFGLGYRAFLPVVHVRSVGQACRNTEVALAAGASGVFLIDMKGRHPNFLLEVCREVHDAFPEAWIGLNMLGHDPEYVLDVVPSYVQGVWSDYAGMPGSNMEQETLRTINEGEDQGLRIIYFGGVAHKASPGETSNPVYAARDASLLCDSMHVVTTSGPGTGMPAPIDKLKAMAEAIGQKPLAVASGVNEQNVKSMIEAGVRAFLVSSSLERVPRSDQLDPELTERMADLIRLG